MKKSESSWKPQTENQNPGWEQRFESQIKRLRQQARILKRNIKKISDETEKARQLELKKEKLEIPQKY